MQETLKPRQRNFYSTSGQHHAGVVRNADLTHINGHEFRNPDIYVGHTFKNADNVINKIRTLWNLKAEEMCLIHVWT